MKKQRDNLKKKRLRIFFSGLEKKSKSSEASKSLENLLAQTGMKYIQMKLPIEKITPEFEHFIKGKIESHIINAKIREVEEEDLTILVDLYNKSWITAREPYSRLSLESLRKIYEYPDTKIFIVRYFGIDAGFVILDIEGENKDIGVIAGLGILPRFQGKGLGKVIGIAAWNYFKDKRIKELRCEVYHENVVSYHFIKSLGFEEYETKVYRREDFELVEETS